MDAKLLVVAGDTKATEVKLRLPSTIGRGREATLTVPHPLVSRQHCEIFEKDGFLVVRDLGSLNGTFIGDERITEAVLHDGDLLTIGTVTFRAVYGDDPNLTAPAQQEPAPDAARERKSVFKGDSGAAVPAGENEIPTTTPQPAASAGGDDESDDEFTAFLESVDVEGEEGETEAAADSFVEPTIQSAAPDFSEHVEEEVEEVEEIEEVAEVADPEPIASPDEPEEVEAIDDVEDVEELDDVEDVEDVEQVDEATPAAPTPPRPAAKAPMPTAPSPKIEVPAEPQPAGDQDEDELQSFLKELEG